MANFTKIFEHHPAMLDFRQAETFSSRGDVLCYQRNLKTPSFSTDGQGFRHSAYKGRNLSIVECATKERYGVVLGPSTIFGTGIAGNENTLPSLLAERFDFPFANGGMPGGSTRTLQGLLVGLLSVVDKRPDVVVLSNGGDLVNFCAGSRADPIFGSPNHIQLKSMRAKQEITDPRPAFERALVFNRIWTGAILTMCRISNIPLILIHQSTFFDKKDPSEVERNCSLGQPASDNQKRVFDNMRQFSGQFYERRKDLARTNNIPLAGLGLTERYNFIDEFHIDRKSMGYLADAVGDAIAEQLGLGASKSVHKAAPKTQPPVASKGAAETPPKAAPKAKAKVASKSTAKAPAKDGPKAQSKIASKGPAEAPAKETPKQASKAKRSAPKKPAAKKKSSA